MRQNIRRMVVILSVIIFHLFLVFHLIFSPVIAIVASRKGIVSASLIVLTIIFFLSLFFGRAYCSWFCPGCGIQEILSLFLRKKAKNSAANSFKYLVFAIWFGFIVFGFIFHGFKEIDPGFGMSDISLERKIILTTGALIITVPFTLVFGRFAFCKYFCWQAPIMIAGTCLRNFFKWKGLRLKMDAQKCTNCKVCVKSCSMNINILNYLERGSINDPECILCGKCMDVCKQKVIKYSI